MLMNERKIEKLQRKFLREKLQRNFLFDGKKNIPNQVKQKTKKRMTKLERKQIEELKNSPEARAKREKRAQKARAKAHDDEQRRLLEAETLFGSLEDDEEEEEFPLLSLPEQKVGLLLEELVQFLRSQRKENFIKGGGKIDLSKPKMQEIGKYLSIKRYRKLSAKHSENCVHLICEALKFPNKEVKNMALSLLQEMINQKRFDVAIFTYIYSRDHVPSGVMRIMLDEKNIPVFKDLGADYWLPSGIKYQKVNEKERMKVISAITDEQTRQIQLKKLEERIALLEQLGMIYKYR